jgi:Rrf2 family protein
VNISARTEYACIAVLALAARYSSGQPVRIREIADPHGIPSRFLVQILLQLKGAGLVESTRGAAGGYKLAKKPEQITLGLVMGVIDGQSGQIKSSTAAATAATRVLLDSWQKIAALEEEKLGEITFAQLAQKLRGQGDGMYYI